MKKYLVSLFGLFILTGFGLSLDNNDWSSYSNVGGQRHSPLNQIGPENVGRLTKVWEYSTGEGPQTTFESTPLVINGKMYSCSTRGRVFSLDATNGELLWSYKPAPIHNKILLHVCRGVSYWESSERDVVCPKRIIHTETTGKLIALDADTGKPCQQFGDKDSTGKWLDYVNLLKDLNPMFPGEVFYTSPPAIFNSKSGRSLIIVGGSIVDNVRVDGPSGAVRAFDVKTGERVWKFETFPRHPKREELTATRDFVKGTPNVWSIITVDQENDLIFLPMGNASPDFFIGNRHDDSRLEYSSSLVVINGAGEYQWHFKTIEKDVWDGDIASQPTLVEFKHKGQKSKAVVLSTKIGHTFVLDRFTGKPIFPVQNVKVPMVGVPGENNLAQFQKISTFPKPQYSDYDASKIDEDWMESLESIDKRAANYCRSLYSTYKSEGPFSPPSLEGSIQFPGAQGGSNWSGNSFDPQRKILVTNFNIRPTVVRLIPRELCPEDSNELGFGGPMLGTQYCVKISDFWARLSSSAKSHLSVLCNPPPWGISIAYDLENEKVIWEKPLGSMKGFAGSVNLGGFLTTQSGLSFIGASADKKFRAFDTQSGETLWETELEAHAMASPMSYMVGQKQYIAVSVGGHVFIDANPENRSDKIVVFSLDH